MNEEVVIRGTIQADGSLQLASPVRLKAGPVEVVVRSIAEGSKSESLTQWLARIHAEQQASGHVPRSAEEVEAYLREMRDEWDERDARIEAIQQAYPQTRESPPGASS